MNPLIIANWKCHPVTLKEAERLFDSFKEQVGKGEVVICPPFVYLEELIDNDYPQIKFGGQNCGWEQTTGLTGEVSALMLKNLGAEYVILGHSERRICLNETEEMINQKLKAALAAGLKPILCVGEQENEDFQQTIFRQIEECLKETDDEIIIVAYEPVWAIGTGNNCPPERAKQALAFLQKILPGRKILYGGSVNNNNVKEYLQTGFDGILVGAASLNHKEFKKILLSL